MGIRAAVVSGCLGVCALAVPVLAQGDCASTTEGGFDQVVFAPDSATFSALLPFDVPVRVCAVVPPGTTKAVVRYAANPRRSGPLDVDPETCEIRTPNVVWSREFDRVPAGTTVRWLIDRLEAERYYAFCFYLERKVTDAEQQAFRAKALEALDQGIAAVTTANLTAEQTNAICQDLASRLSEVTGTGQILQKQGTLFACDGAKVADFAGKVNRGPLQAQRRSIQVVEGSPPDEIPSLATQQNALQADLARLQQSAGLGKLVDVVGRLAATDPEVAGREQSLCPDCTAIAGAAATPAPRLALGGIEGAVLGTGSEPALAQQASTSYASTASALAGLPALIDWATGPNAPPALEGALTADERTELAALSAPGGPLALAAGKATTLGSVTAMLARHLQARTAGLAELADQAVVEARSVVLADATTLANFETNQKNYISMDAGMTWAPELDEVVPYVGTNVYFRPVNRNAPLSTLGNFRQTFWRRFALTFALTASSIADEGEGGAGAGAGTPTRDDLFASQSLLVGAGVRVTDAMRLGAGAIVFKHDDPSPLVDESELNSSYYLSLSFDADVAKMFSKMFGDALGANAAGTP